jgi:hypothetical protein
VLLDLLHNDPTLAAARPGQVLIADKNHYGRDFEAALAGAGIELLRRARQGEPAPAGDQFFKPRRQTVERFFDTFKGQLDLERHGGHTPTGVVVRVLQRLLAMTTAIWHNDHWPTHQTVTTRLQPLTHLGIDHLGVGLGPVEVCCPPVMDLVRSRALPDLHRSMTEGPQCVRSGGRVGARHNRRFST